MKKITLRLDKKMCNLIDKLCAHESTYSKKLMFIVNNHQAALDRIDKLQKENFKLSDKVDLLNELEDCFKRLVK